MDAENALKYFEKVVATHPEIALKGAANKYTSLNGHMFSFLTKEGHLALRLPKEEREQFLKKQKTQLAVSHATVMKEYALVPDSLFKRTSALAKHFAVSVAYIASLKPKPTTKPKSKKGASKKKAAKKAAKKTAKKSAKKVVGKKTSKKATKKAAAKKAGAKKATAKKKPTKKKATRKR